MIFKKIGITIPYPLPHLEKADIVMIIFEFQKTRDIQVHMFRTSDDILNPVIAWAKTVDIFWNYSGATENSKVCTFMNLTGHLS